MAQSLSGQHESPILQKFPPLSGNRNFILLWAGYVVSAVGDRIHFLVMLQLLTNVIGAITHNPKFVAGTQQSSQLTILMLLPFVLLGPITGIIADRLPRRLIMIVADIVRVVIVITARTVFIEFQGPLGLTNVLILLFVSEFILAAFAALFSPARLALLPTLVHPDQLLRANSMTNAAGTIASLLGFVLGGKLVAWHLVYAMYIDAGTFALSASLLLMMRLPRRQVNADTVSQSPKTGLLTDFKEGIHYILAHKRVLQIISLMLLFWCCGTIILNGLTGIVTDYYGLKLEWFSYFMGLSGVGMIIGAGLVSMARHGIPKEVGIAWSMVAVGVFLFLFSQVTKQHWPLALVLLTVSAIPSAVLLISLETLLQRVVPNFVRGRVMGVKDVITTFGLISVAIPLAINPRIDEIIRLVLSVLSIVVVGGGFVLVVYYYKRQSIPWPAAICRRVAAAYLSIWKRFSRVVACTLTGTGPVIFVANHSIAMVPIFMQVSSPRRVIHFMMAKEYYEKSLLIICTARLAAFR